MNRVYVFAYVSSWHIKESCLWFIPLFPDFTLQLLRQVKTRFSVISVPVPVTSEQTAELSRQSIQKGSSIKNGNNLQTSFMDGPKKFLDKIEDNIDHKIFQYNDDTRTVYISMKIRKNTLKTNWHMILQCLASP